MFFRFRGKTKVESIFGNCNTHGGIVITNLRKMFQNDNIGNKLYLLYIREILILRYDV